MKATCFGEVLWDVFPTHKKIGGAPLNVAVRLTTMGIDTALISKVGDDTLGEEIVSYLKNYELSTDTIQKDEEQPTGEVTVHLDDQGTASYTINEPVAWDFIELTESTRQKVKEAEVFIYGSLASRNPVSRNTLFQLLELAKFKVLDINLRPPFYDKELLLQLMTEADFIKCNDEELEEIKTYLGIHASEENEIIREVAKFTNTQQICVTRGGKGAVLFVKEVFYNNDGYTIKVVDTVGAGDSFLATLLTNLVQGQAPQKSLDKACAIGAMVAGSEGANPVFTEEEIEGFLNMV